MKIPRGSELRLRQFAADGRSVESMIEWCRVVCGTRVAHRSIFAYFTKVCEVDAMGEYLRTLHVVKRDGAFPFPEGELAELDAAVTYAARVREQADKRGLPRLALEATRLGMFARISQLKVDVAAGRLEPDKLQELLNRMKELETDPPPPSSRPRLRLVQ